jgi:hypothetical protein
MIRRRSLDCAVRRGLEAYVGSCAPIDFATMDERPDPRAVATERLWRGLFFGASALMGGFALVDLEAGRLAGAAGDAGVSCLLLSLMNQFPMVSTIIGTASKRASADQLRREAERLRSDHPWTERAASAGWVLLFGSLLLRALGVD